MHRHPTADDRSGVAQTGRTDALDVGLALVLAAALFALYRATFQARLFGDGGPLVRFFLASLDDHGVWPHILYMPAARALERVLQPQSPVDALRLLSSLGAALAAGCVYLLARAFGARRGGALCACLLLALGPGFWFFATTIEVVGLQLACVGLTALVTVYAPWQRPWSAACLAAASLPLLYLGHQSGLFLGPGHVLLAQFARRRRTGTLFSWPALLLGVGPLFLASLLAALGLAAHLRHMTVLELVHTNASFVAEFDSSVSSTVLYRGWVEPLGVLSALALIALASGRLRGWALAAVLGLVAPSLVFFTLWGMHERGAYALASALFLTVPVACLLSVRRPLPRVAALLLVVLQATLGCTLLLQYDAPHWGEERRSRAADVRAELGEQGVLFSLDVRFQTIEADLPGVSEVNLFSALRVAMREGRSPEEFASACVERVAAALDSPGGRVALDVTDAPLVGRPESGLSGYLEALDRSLRARFRLTPVETSRWTLLRIE